MAKTLPISTTTNIFLAIRNTILKGVALCSDSAASILEVFDGAIDTVETLTIFSGGSGYSVGDLITLVEGEFGGTKAILRVSQTDDNSPSSSISASPSSSISTSPSESSSPSSSASPSTSISQSASGTPSDSPSSSVSSSPSPSVSPSSSISSSPSASASPSSSVSSSESSSLSPSAGAGFITGLEILEVGGGYTGTNSYATTTDGDGSDALITVDTVVDVGVSIAKLSAATDVSAAPITFEDGILTTGGISVRMEGSGALGHITYE